MDYSNLDIGKFIQRIIDKLRGKPDIIALSEYVTVLAGLQKVSKDINTIAIGSSHFMCGILPEENQYKLSLASLDLYYSYELYKKYAQNIKNVVLDFSYFSPFHVTVKTLYAPNAMVIKLLTGIDYQFSEVAKEKKLDKLEKMYGKYILKSYNKKVNFLPDNYTGLVMSYNNSYNAPSEDTIKTMKKTFNREHIQMQYLNKIAEETIKNNQNLLIVCPPLSADFIKNFKSETDIVISELYDNLKNYPQVKVLNCFEDNDFTNSDFDDIEHLAYSGAKKLTQKIQNELRKFN